MSESEFTRMLRLKREEREKKYADQTDPAKLIIFEKFRLIFKALKIDKNRSKNTGGVNRHHFRLS